MDVDFRCNGVDNNCTYWWNVDDCRCDEYSFTKRTKVRETECVHHCFVLKTKNLHSLRRQGGFCGMLKVLLGNDIRKQKKTGSTDAFLNRFWQPDTRQNLICFFWFFRKKSLSSESFQALVYFHNWNLFFVYRLYIHCIISFFALSKMLRNLHQ